MINRKCFSPNSAYKKLIVLIRDVENLTKKKINKKKEKILTVTMRYQLRSNANFDGIFSNCYHGHGNVCRAELTHLLLSCFVCFIFFLFVFSSWFSGVHNSLQSFCVPSHGGKWKKRQQQQTPIINFLFRVCVSFWHLILWYILLHTWRNGIFSLYDQ